MSLIFFFVYILFWVICSDCQIHRTRVWVKYLKLEKKKKTCTETSGWSPETLFNTRGDNLVFRSSEIGVSALLSLRLFFCSIYPLIFCFHSCVDRYLDCFHLLRIVNYAAVNGWMWAWCGHLFSITLPLYWARIELCHVVILCSCSVILFSGEFLPC